MRSAQRPLGAEALSTCACTDQEWELPRQLFIRTRWRSRINGVELQGKQVVSGGEAGHIHTR